jgi:hypothetical protein
VTNVQPETEDTPLKFAGARFGLVERRIDQDERELFTAVTTRHVRVTEVREEQVGERSQQDVADVVAVGIVERLEVVDVDLHDADLDVVASRARQFANERLFHVAPIEEIRQWITNRWYVHLRR